MIQVFHLHIQLCVNVMVVIFVTPPDMKNDSDVFQAFISETLESFFMLAGVTKITVQP